MELTFASTRVLAKASPSNLDPNPGIASLVWKSKWTCLALKSLDNIYTLIVLLLISKLKKSAFVFLIKTLRQGRFNLNWQCLWVCSPFASLLDNGITRIIVTTLRSKQLRSRDKRCDLRHSLVYRQESWLMTES
jgi:Na+/H+ antiporter NhaD/arsenite permease-like protein